MNLRRLFAHRHFPALILLTALVLTLPSLWGGLQFDDYLLQTRLLAARNKSVDDLTTINQLYVFMDGDSAHTQAQMDSGRMPWFALPSGKVAFWRPLSALTHWLDFQLWPQSLALMHLHSLVWFLALVFSVSMFYRQYMVLQVSNNEQSAQWTSVSIGALAAYLYCLDDARGFAVGWLSNRNGLIAAVFGILTLITHHRWRTQQGHYGLLIAPALFLLALLSGESALAVLAYLFAYTLFLENRSGFQRVMPLIPYLILLVLWEIAYTTLGFGAWGTSYIEPGREPLRFIQTTLTRAPILFLGQWAYPPAEFYSLLTPPASPMLWAIANLLTLLIAIYLWPLVRTSALARFYALGLVLSLIPASAALPANRLLFFVGLGAMGLLALRITTSSSNKLMSNRTGLVLSGLTFIHAFIGPVSLHLASISPALIGNIEPSINALPISSSFASQSAIFVNAPSHFYIAYLPDIRALSHQPIPAHLRVLAPSFVSTTYTRSDSQTLIVHPQGGYLTGFDTVYRDPAYPMQTGQIVLLPDVEIKVLELTPDNRPAMVAFKFKVPLEDSSLIWFQWDGERYQPFTPPAIGQTIQLEPVNPLSNAFSFLKQ